MYRISKKAKNYKDATIEKKYEHTITFSIAEIEAHEVKLEKLLKEIEGLVEVEGAKVKNIEANHKWVKTMTPQDLLTAWMYYESLHRIQEVLPKRAEVKKQMKEYKKEKAEIIKALGFDESEA
jgi:uncharacterized coiled-coil DUF342 family protein